ncbi:MAG: acyl-CoA dehydrogenase family protein [Pseudomonadales bacterium]|nr:acyl-CoA dehydrogenase family protein [Pseudomonadales bacterium]
MTDNEAFRAETRTWLEANCPQSIRGVRFGIETSHEVYKTKDGKAWLDAMASRGWTAPTWPKKYTGGGLNHAQATILGQELKRINAGTPGGGMGMIMIGPTLLEFGTEEQKQRHIPKIVSGEVVWCQGYSEPGAGSDLASVQTKAVIDGDRFVINGQKIWTSMAQIADWMFALVRTDPDASKHDGISFVLLDMHQPGVSIKPIRLISGSSPFCETFFDDAIAQRDNLVGELNKGWTVAKRLLQFERSSIGGMSSGDGKKKSADKKAAAKPVNEFASLAKTYIGEIDGKISDPETRDEILRHVMKDRAFKLTTKRVGEEARAGMDAGDTATIFKLVGSYIQQDSSSLKGRLMGTQGVGWEGPGFEKNELVMTKLWLANRATSIYGGTNEVQMNIIAKRVLQLPE